MSKYDFKKIKKKKKKSLQSVMIMNYNKKKSLKYEKYVSPQY